MELITEDEIHEIQRIWRTEMGDWKNTAYQIYEKVLGERLEALREDIAGLGKLEQDTLEEICSKGSVPHLLVSKLLNAEYEYQGMSRHSKIYDKINKILSEEWRNDLDAIVDDLQKRHDLLKGYDG